MPERKVTKVRCENVRDNMLYFCDIFVDGERFKVAYGNTKTTTNETWYYERSGQRYDTPAAAMAELEKLLAGRCATYQTKTRTEEMMDLPDDGLAPHAENVELEAELATGGAGAASVYADWLQTQGDIRGELASLHLAGRTDEANAWLTRNQSSLFGTLDVALDSEIYDLVWTNGLLSGASLKTTNGSDTDLAILTRDFLKLPITRTITALRFGLASYESDNDWGETITAVAESDQASRIRSLRFDDYTYEDCEISWTAFGDFSDAWESLPALEELVIRSGEGGSLGTLDLPNLRTFKRISGGLGTRELDEILAAKWPKLETLEVWFGCEGYGAGGTADHVTKLLAAAPPTLSSLGIVNCEITHELVAILAKSPVTKQLRVLDLSKSVLRDGDVELVLAHADAFAHLERFDLSENLFGDGGYTICVRLPNAVTSGQRDDDRDRRYAALGE